MATPTTNSKGKMTDRSRDSCIVSKPKVDVSAVGEGEFAASPLVGGGLTGGESDVERAEIGGAFRHVDTRLPPLGQGPVVVRDPNTPTATINPVSGKATIGTAVYLNPQASPASNPAVRNQDAVRDSGSPRTRTAVAIARRVKKSMPFSTYATPLR